MTMWSAVSLRIRLHGSTRSPGHGFDRRAPALRRRAGSGGTAGSGAAGHGRPCRRGRRGRRCAGRLEEAQDVLLGHAPGDAGARNGADVDAVLGGDLPHQRRGAPAQPLFGRFRTGGCRRLGCRGQGRGRSRRGVRRRPGRRRGGRGAGAAAARGGGCRGGGRRAPATAAAASVSIRATTVCTATVWPSVTMISARTPAWARESRRPPCRSRSRRSARRA